MPPEAIGGKFCRLDVNMTVDGRRMDLEIQVQDEHDFPERSLFHWAREYSAALGGSIGGADYGTGHQGLPRLTSLRGWNA
jgi:hypothetical protein